MLDLKAVDLKSLCTALEDHSDSTEWWFDPETGAVEAWPSDPGTEELDEVHPEERDWIRVEPVPSHDSYRDLVDFTEHIRDPRARAARASDRGAGRLPALQGHAVPVSGAP